MQSLPIIDGANCPDSIPQDSLQNVALNSGSFEIFRTPVNPQDHTRRERISKSEMRACFNQAMRRYIVTAISYRTCFCGAC